MPTEFWFGALAAILIVLFVGIAIVMQFVRADLSIVRSPMTHYLRGSWGSVTRVGYAWLMLALIAYAIASTGDSSFWGRSSSLLFALAGLCLILVDVSTGAALPDISQRSHALVLLHRYSAYAGFLFVIAGASISSFIATSLQANPIQRVLAGSAVALFLLMTLAPDAPKGLPQKILLLAIAGWIFTAAATIYLSQPVL